MTNAIEFAHDRITPPDAVRGATLVVALIMLLLLTILGVTAMSTNTLQERMAGNYGGSEAAFQAAESADRAGEDSFINVTTKPQTAGTLGSCTQTPCVYDFGVPGNFLDTAHTDHWWLNTAGATQETSVNAQANFLHDPMFVIEYRGFKKDDMLWHSSGPPSGIDYYRITAIGWDPKYTGAIALVQSIYGKRF
jgi:type IV pilus assembly protein PilX